MIQEVDNAERTMKAVLSMEVTIEATKKMIA